MYTATEAAFVEWVDGNPYSRLVLLERVIRWSGGESGRGIHKRSFKKPLKKTPDAKTCTILQGVSTARRRVIGFYPRPKLVYPHQKSIGRMIMKKVWVPRFAVTAK